MLDHQLDHAGAALGKLAEQFKNKAKLAAFVAVFTKQMQAIEDAFWQLYTERWVDTAMGPQLDVIGRIVGQRRDNSVDDDEYRTRIKARVRCNRSSGTIRDIYAVFRVLLPAGTPLLFTRGNVAAFTFTIGTAITAAYAKLYAGFLGSAKAAGVGGGLLWQMDDDAAMFTCDVATYLSVGDPGGAGHTTLHTIGGATMALFPASGNIVVDRGLATEESLVYGSRDVLNFYLTSVIVHAHAQRAAVSWDQAPGEGFASVSNPTAGGQLAGAIAS